MTRTILIAAIAALLATPAFAEIRITGDAGGEVTSYINKYELVRASGDNIIIDGPCVSACTLLTGIVPRDHVCVTSRAQLVFHAASIYDDAKRELVPTREGTGLIMQVYPHLLQSWIRAHGGLTNKLIALRGRELSQFYHSCQ